MNELNLVFNTFERAMDIHQELFIVLREKGVVSFNDLADIMGLETLDPLVREKYESYGWDYLCGVEIIETGKNRWEIKLPKAIQINQNEKEKK